MTFRCTLLAWRIGLANEDRDAVSGWIKGQADRQEGKLIAGDLPRLPDGERSAGAGPGLLDRDALPAIRTFDGSGTLAESLSRPGSGGPHGDLLRLGDYAEIRILEVADFVELIREAPT